MKASELRIGNWLQRLDGSLFQVNEHDFKILANGLPDNLHPKPIPLTEEWLLKFGFESTTPHIKPFQCWAKGNIEVGYTTKDDVLQYEYLSVINTEMLDIQFVHQLQNLYFALTGEELTVNEK